MDAADSTKNEQSDYLDANTIKIGTMEVFFMPAVVSFFIYYTNFANEDTRKEVFGNWTGWIFMLMQILQSMATFFLDFVNLHAPNSPLRNRYMPKIHFLVAIIAFGVIPVLTIAYYLIEISFNTKEIWRTRIGTWLLTYTLTSLSMAFWVPLVIYPVAE